MLWYFAATGINTCFEESFTLHKGGTMIYYGEKVKKKQKKKKVFYAITDKANSKKKLKIRYS